MLLEVYPPWLLDYSAHRSCLYAFISISTADTLKGYWRSCASRTSWHKKYCSWQDVDQRSPFVALETKYNCPLYTSHPFSWVTRSWWRRWEQRCANNITPFLWLLGSQRLSSCRIWRLIANTMEASRRNKAEGRCTTRGTSFLDHSGMASSWVSSRRAIRKGFSRGRKFILLPREKALGSCLSLGYRVTIPQATSHLYKILRGPHPSPFNKTKKESISSDKEVGEPRCGRKQKTLAPFGPPHGAFLSRLGFLCFDQR